MAQRAGSTCALRSSCVRREQDRKLIEMLIEGFVCRTYRRKAADGTLTGYRSSAGLERGCLLGPLVAQRQRMQPAASGWLMSESVRAASLHRFEYKFGGGRR